MKVRAIVERLAFVWRAKKIWRRPRQASTLIYDRAGSAELLEYIDARDVAILDVRGESINIPVLLKCLFDLKFSLVQYASEYVSFAKPAVAITLIDNNRDFYQLKNAHPKLVTMFVQNGWRTELGDLFGHLKRDLAKQSYRVDYMLTFGAAQGGKYRQHIEGQVIPIGGLNNNLCRPVQGIEAGTLVFISQFRPRPLDTEAVFFFDGPDPILWADWCAAERKLLPFLARYCERKSLTFQVCGFYDDATGPEYEYFKALMGEADWQFIPRREPYGSYKAVDRAEVVVFIDTTLGYEALARGKKTAAFSIRGKTLQNPATKFGWPAPLPDDGPFWTNHADEREFERVLDYVTSASDADWKETSRQYVPHLMEYDPGNTRFISLLEHLGVQLNEKVRPHAH